MALPDLDGAALGSLSGAAALIGESFADGVEAARRGPDILVA